MAFCKELFAPPPNSVLPRAHMTPEEKEKAWRAWWETEVHHELTELVSSARVQRACIALLLLILLLK